MAFAQPSSTPDNPLIARAAETVSDTYFIESWGLEGGMTALRNQIAWHQRILAETEAFAATLTDDERASISVMPVRETAQSTFVGLEPKPLPDGVVLSDFTKTDFSEDDPDNAVRKEAE